ncbi:hypothetical protein Bhyg_02679 [Pseudolycoriella hygida]|uniref:Cupin-like domain-containing protein n=1 Tax=Pseudolycoriella hygida TaxID=35572 RepID=A0A9Q0NBV8_9DIPT|nr:hypothetical protein Bhyg_02679 [Pseudolycoriella hygida]
MSRKKNKIFEEVIRPELDKIHNEILKHPEITVADLYDAYKKSLESEDSRENIIFSAIGMIFFIVIAVPIVNYVFAFILGIRCFIPNNYVVWEATRPIANCAYCQHVRGPLILPNMTREEFLPYAYSPQPIIIKNSISHWPAGKLLNYNYLKNLYSKYKDDLNSFSDECQFLNFKSNFLILRDLFEMPPERAENGTEPWYVGFSNCQTKILNELRKLYPVPPHFLPADTEIPSHDYIFMGYDDGANMHLDYIPRLMWQAQLRGNKTWTLAPTPECSSICDQFTFYVESGDAVLIDTRIWYHGTSIKTKKQFSLTIQSEYG